MHERVVMRFDGEVRIPVTCGKSPNAGVRGCGVVK